MYIYTYTCNHHENNKTMNNVLLVHPYIMAQVYEPFW